VVTATDEEPGSFVDRTLLRQNPFAVIEGAVVTALAVDVSEVFIAIRRSFVEEYEILAAALAEAEVAGWFDRVSVKCVRVGEEYLIGDARGLLESMEGRAAMPRRAQADVEGLFARDRGEEPTTISAVTNPTCIETAETVVNVAAILAHGARWFRSMGTAVSPGHLMITVSGDVNRHAVREVEIGRRLVDLLEEVGDGFLPNVAPKAVLSGVSSRVLTRSRLAAPLSWEGLSSVGASIGRAAYLVHGEPTNMVEVAYQVAAFLALESCALCPPCKYGGSEVAAFLGRLVAGYGATADMEAVMGRLATVTDGRRCELATRQRDVVSSILRAFPGDVIDVASRSGGTTPPPIGRILNLVDGRTIWEPPRSASFAVW
jgi:NADH:ubiquinone oxidoreductase subunit F (NADH-binding)